LVFRFIGDGQQSLAAFQSGECAVVANTPDLVNFYPQMLALEEENALYLVEMDQPAWEQISFGINSLDNSRRLLRDSRLRKAISYCIDREAIAARRKDAGPLVNNLFHPQDPRSDPDLVPLVYQPGEAIRILETLGWVDDDQDPATGRKAAGVEGIPWGTSLELSLLVPGVEGDSITAVLIQEQLATCGVEVEIEYLPPAEMLAAGPEGPVFGRQFDLALFSWTTGSFHLCQIFQTSEVPGVYPTFAMGWGGANAPGYNNPTFDQACNTVMTNLPDSDFVGDATRELQTIFADDLPILPLFFRQEVIIFDPALTGLQPGFFMPLWEIEQIKLLD
jgi:peptide/nickel transport system substrate-binding protein